MANTSIPRRLNLSVQYAIAEASQPNRKQIRAWVRAVETGAAQVVVRFVGKEEGRALNTDWRGKDYATNVLSFPYETEPVLMGDLVLCWPVVLQEAQEQGKVVLAHSAHLIVHGILHLQGFDHELDSEAEEMEKREQKILTKLGYPDPYAVME